MIRVLRVIEYTYPDGDAMIADQERWAVPANGVAPFIHREGKSIKSATLPPEVIGG